ncbi:MAG: phosphate acyltransferase PlsX [Bauldia sp.]
MADSVIISVDAMGGDHGPAVTVAGAALALERAPDMMFRFFGDQRTIEDRLATFPAVANVATVVHSDIAVHMSDKPSQALRRGRWKSGMWLAIEAVKKGEADVAVSAGNTGALMAMSRLCLRTMAGMDRPAIAALWPTLAGESVVLDVGATIGADAQQLVDYAIMGGAMARALFHKDRPKVGLLNIGVEEQKGLEGIREASRMLREADLPHLDYVGFIEGDELGKGLVDVAVTEGFAGNIALKTAEGTARQIAEYLRQEMGRTLPARLGYVLARGAFATLREKLDPNRSNGGVMLGLNGIVIKSHGGAGADGFASALCRGHAMVRNGLLAKIRQDHAYLYPNNGADRLSAPEQAEDTL